MCSVKQSNSFLGECLDNRPGYELLFEFLDNAGLCHQLKELVEVINRFRVKALQERRGEVAVDFDEPAIYKAISYPRDFLP